MPLEFVVPDSIVEVHLSKLVHLTIDGENVLDSVIAGHITRALPELIILDGIHMIPRGSIVMVTLLDPGIGVEAYQRQVAEQREAQQKEQRRGHHR